MLVGDFNYRIAVSSTAATVLDAAEVLLHPLMLIWCEQVKDSMQFLINIFHSLGWDSYRYWPHVVKATTECYFNCLLFNVGCHSSCAEFNELPPRLDVNFVQR